LQPKWPSYQRIHGLEQLSDGISNGKAKTDEIGMKHTQTRHRGKIAPENPNDPKQPTSFVI
jgi:hypothetical protein